MLMSLRLIIFIEVAVGIIFIIYKSRDKILDNNKILSIEKGQKLYKMLTVVPIIGPSIERLKRKLYYKSKRDDVTLRHNAVLIFCISSIGAAAVFLLLLRFYVSDFYTFFAMICISIFAKNIITEWLLGSGEDTKFLKELIEFTADVKQGFHQHKNIVDAYYEATEVATPVMAAQGAKIKDSLAKGITGLNQYYEECPNKMLKILVSFSFITKEFGDKTINGVSLFVKNLNYIIEEMQMELIKKEALQHAMRILSVIVLLPILFPNPMETWVRDNFPSSSVVYDSAIGYFSKVIVLTITFSLYLLLKQQQRSEEDSMDRMIKKEKYLEQTILENKWIASIVEKVTPKINSNKYKKVKKLIEDSGVNTQVQWIYLRKLGLAITTFIVMIGLFVGSHNSNINRIKNDFSYGIPNKEFSIMSGAVDDSPEKKKEAADLDKEIIKDKNSKKESKAELEKSIKSNGKGVTSKEQLAIAVERIQSKIKAIDNEHIKWYDVVISLFIAIIAWNIPTLLLLLKKKLREISMENEVCQFDTIVLLLMYHDRADVYMVLEWMERFSDVFYNPLRRCLNNYHGGAEIALKQLHDEVNFKPFKRIVKNLMIAEENIKLRDAFDSLESDREFYKIQRKEMNEKQVKNKIAMAELFAQIPFFVTTFLYLIVPISITVYTQIQEIIKGLNQL